MLNWLRQHISYENPVRRAWHFFKGITAACLYRFPARKLICIGITGTNGKTTTTHLTEHLLRGVGLPTAMISTISFSVNGNTRPNETKKTTLSPFLTQKFLRQCVQKGAKYAVIECSSHALHQHRLIGIPFRVAALTNITHEHLDYHGTMDQYKEAKKMLFKKVETAVLNTSDAYFEEFMKLQVPHKITYGRHAGYVQARDPRLFENGTDFFLHCGTESVEVRLNIPGEFNIENALAATGVALSCDLPLEQIAQGLSTFQGVPGRMERIRSPKGFEVIVDFGLTPDALQKLYSTIAHTAPARIIGIIGSCGDRDKTKRPELGRIVAEHCDITLVTDEEPYSEDPRAIMQAVLGGALSTGKREGTEVLLIEDRYQAIEYAVKNTRPDDTIVITGMGNFQTRQMNSGPIPWDEREVVREIIAKHAC